MITLIHFPGGQARLKDGVDGGDMSVHHDFYFAIQSAYRARADDSWQTDACSSFAFIHAPSLMSCTGMRHDYCPLLSQFLASR